MASKWGSSEVWEKAVAEYNATGQTSAGGGSAGWGNSSAWQTAVAEYNTLGADGFKDLLNKKKKDKEFSNSVSRFFNDVNTFRSSVNRDLSENQFNAADYFEERKKQADALKQRAATISLYLEDNANLYTPDYYDSLMQTLSTFNTEVDDVLSSYKPSLDAREGMRAYEDEFIAAQERNEQLRGLDRSADFAFDPGSPAANIMAMFRKKQYDEGDRGIKDNWSDEQRYRLGLMQMEDPTGAKQYAKDINAGQDPYMLYEQQEQQKADWRAMDLNAERREIDRLKAELDDYYWNYNYDATATNARNAFDQEIKRREKEISDREQQYNLAKREQESAQFASAATRNDFKAKSGYVDSGFVVPTFVEDADPDELVYEYINNQSVRSQINQQTNTLAAKGYDLLTPEEVGIYNYYYATEGAGKAQQYLDNIQDTLNQRIGERGAAAKQGELWKQLMAAGISGYSNAVTSPQYFFNKKDDYINTSPFQYMSAAIREDLADTGKHPFFDTSLGQVGYDLINTTANMAPSMLLSAGTGALGTAIAGAAGSIPAIGSAAGAMLPKLGAAVGSATMGLSAAGGAYQQALNSGYTKEQARTYAALSGASEVALEYLLGGISKLGGEIPQKVISDMVSGIDNAIGRAAVQIGGNMASEGFEEGLQEVITPWIENLTLYADKNVDWNEVAYSTLLGALSGGVMEAPGVIKSETQIAKINNQLINLGAKGNTREMAELIAKYKNQEVLSDKELIKLVNSEPAMEIIRGKRNSSNESATVIQDAEVPKVAQPQVSMDGRAVQISTDNPVDVLDFASMDNGVATVQLNDGETAAYDDIAFKDQQQANQFYAVRSLPGLDTESANNLLHTIQDADAGKDIDSVVGIREAYAMGYYNQSESDLAKGDAAALTPELRKAVFDIGRQQNQAQEKIQPKAKAVTAKPTQGYKKITIEGKITKLDKKRKAEMAYVDTIADNFAGTAVHVYESYVGADGKRYFRDNNGVKHKAPNGKYINGEIWLDINSGDNGEGMMLNTFAHEMYHHIEKFNKEKANELASFVSRELGIDNVETAVQAQIDKARAAGYGEDYFKNQGMTDIQATNEVYARAMSDFVADSLETMFTRGDPAKAIANLKKENKGLFDQIKAFIDEWISKVKKFYSDKTISQEGAAVAQLEKFEQLQQLFMEAMQGAGENYLAAEVADEKSVPREKYEKFSFAGRESATADKSALQQAEELAQKGVPNETIRKQTGWYKGMDGKWRYEIDDSQMEITDDIINYMSLGELMQHEKLYAAYPDLADISVVFQGLDKGVNGAYNAQFDSINLSYRLKNDPVGLKDALVHEIQHAIQHREGFTSGATVGQWERKIKAGFDSRRAADIRKAQDTERELRRIQNEEPEFYRDMMELDAMTPDLPRGEVDWETLEKISDDPIEWQQYDARREELEAKYGDTKVWDMNDLLYQREQAAKNVGRSGVELYFDTAGEIEARDASNRRSKSPEQRKSSPPILGNEDTVFAEGNANETERFSLRHEKPATAREILSQIDISTRKKNEAHFLGQYQENLSKLADLEPRLAELNAQIEELFKDQKGNLKEITRLQKEQRQVKASVNRLKGLVNAFERSDMGKRLVSEYKLKEQKRQAKETRKDFKAEQKELIQTMQAEQRAIREELTGKISDVTIMEREFIRLAKKYEQLDTRTGKSSIKDAKAIAQLKADLKAEAKSHKEDSKIWEREFNRLLTDYETAGRQIARLEATIARQRATAKARVEGRRKTEMRHKIQRKVNELDQLLRHGTKHRNVPEFLQDSVAAVLQAINMEVRDGDQRRKTFEATLARYDRQIAMTSDPDKVSELIRKRNEYEAKGDQFANRMEMLQAAYKQIREENTGMELDEGIAGKLDSLFEVVGNTPLGQMNAAQLEAVNDILNVTQATIRNANELLAEERSAGVVENSKDAIREIRSMGDTKKKKTRIRKDLEKFGWNNLKPIYVFDVIGSKTLTNLYNALRGGEDTLATDLHEAKSFFQEQWKKNNGKEWDMDQKWKFTSTSGKEFELDLNQIMTLYAMAKDEDARSHLRVGGFSFDSDYQTEENVNIGKVSIPVKMESTDASAYNLSDEILGEIISKLTPQQRAFADAMQAYLSDVMAAKGNEVSLKKYGIRLFKKKNYFPIRVADQFMAKAREQRNGDRKLKDSGFTKERKPQAKNPVVLSAFTEIWAEHVDEMSLYHSFVLPLDDFNRVLNYHDMFVEGQDAVSVVEAITNAFGKGATNYIDQLIKDVNGGIRGGSTVSFANSLVSKAKKAQTMASLSVAIQQPSSIIRAMSMIDSRYFIGHRVTEKTHNRTWDEIKQYAPIAYIKEMGGYDTNVGKSTVDYLTDTADYETFMEKFGALFTDEKFRDDALGRLPALMDEMSWGVIWNAVKREQSAQHPNMDVNSKAFMNLVADRFTDVITRTQVYDSVFSRSGLMRDKNDLAKVITSFMAEPTTTANMLAVAVLQAKRGDISKAQIAKTTAAIVASLALNAALVSTVYALRDDDEDKRYDEKWMENFRNNFFESLNPAGYIPYVRDIYNVFVKGYDVERADMELFGDLQNALDGLKNDDISAWDKTSAVIGSIGNLLGVPVKNILRDVKGIVQTAGFAWDDKPNPRTKTGAYMARRGMDLNNGEEMILALQRGDMEHIQRVFGRYESQEKAESALQSAIGEKYRAGEMSAEEATKLLTDYFDREAYEVYWILDKWDYAVENGTSEGYSKYGAFLDAIDNGGDYVAEMQRYLEHGSEMSDLSSAISSEYKKLYLAADDADREEIRDKLTPVYLETDMYESEIQKKFNDWDFEAEYGYTYSDYKAAYRDGEITEQDLRGAMKFYGLKNFEIDKEIRSLNEDIAFRKKYDMTLSEMKDAYDNGDVAKNTMKNALLYSGMTATEAQDWIKKRDISNRLGTDYMELDDAYKAGDISRQTLYNAMIEAGSTKREADDAIVAYDWLKQNYKKYPDLAIGDANKFVIKISDNDEEHTLADYGVTIDHYIQYAKLKPECKGVDANGDGKTDDGTLRDSIFRMIDSLPISDSEKDGLALISYGIKSIRKNAPWHKK